MDTASTKKGLSGGVHQINSWFDQLLPQASLLPHQQQQQESTKHTILKSRWFRLSVVVYILFSILLTAAHVASWLFSGPSSPSHFHHTSRGAMDTLSYQRTYDAGHYDALKYVQPFWQRAASVPEPQQVSFIVTTTPNTWRDLVQMAKNWNGPISATLHISSKHDKHVLTTIEAEYKAKPELFQNVDLHLVETPNGIEKMASIMVPVNVERNLARIYARTDHVSDVPFNIVIATDLRQTLEKNQARYTQLLSQGDMLVIPTFQYDSQQQLSQMQIPQTKKELVGLVEGEHLLGLYDAHFELNQGPTDFKKWKNADALYAVTDYTMDYEPVVIQSKTVQPWCSERFVDKKSACLLSSYLAGNDFLVLPHDFAIQKPSNKKTAISDLDSVIEKRLYSKFYWEQCVYQGRQLDALGLWNSKKSEHIRQQCSRVIQNWGRGLIGKPE
ncbi:glycosyltransferase family 49 protein [Mucor lusitanicus CBS 277.49]|uniref:Glycosyltransferase family 49 protein n=1 Tax=Mucor lusitanicus CBS 277.49 TaxID=747725 RepID=A0A168KH74_MUCCL|nr:glycosyltransferase family 49 protein [Mucor lusitanicus CBS 277.49]